MYRYTLNSEGAPVGWHYKSRRRWKQRVPFLQGLYQAGHWVGPSGALWVTRSGKWAADLVLRDLPRVARRLPPDVGATPALGRRSPRLHVGSPASRLLRGRCRSGRGRLVGEPLSLAELHGRDLSMGILRYLPCASAATVPSSSTYLARALEEAARVAGDPADDLHLLVERHGLAKPHRELHGDAPGVGVG